MAIDGHGIAPPCFTWLSNARHTSWAAPSQSTAASHALSSEAAELERLVSRFKVGAEVQNLRTRDAPRPAAAPTRESFRQRYVAGNTALKVEPSSRPGDWEEF